MRPFSLLLSFVLSLSTLPAAAADADWMSSVFPERIHNFGAVARGSQVRYSFPVVNRTNTEVHIASWTTKCGCTNVKVGARVIPPGTQTTIEATIDTTRFVGHKDSGLTLLIDRPSAVSVDLNVTCFIRGEITLTPGQVDFGAVRRSGKLPSASLTLTYAGGRPGWEIAEMKTRSARVKAVAERISQSATNQWMVTATLQPDIPNGSFKDEITLITNDSPPATIPISVVANVQSAVAATPSIINFGAIRPGQSVTKVVHVRSTTAFALTKIEANRADLQAVEQDAGSCRDHTVKLTITAPATPGPFHGVVKIESDVKDEPPALIKTFATIASSP